MAINAQVWEFLLSGGIFMIPIGICSFVGIAVSIHRALSLRWNAVIPPPLRPELARAGEVFREGRGGKLLLDLKRSDSVVGRIGRVALSSEFKTREEAQVAVEATAREQMVKLESGIGLIEMIVTIAPLLGLLGTVSGLVGVFGAFGSGGGQDADPSRVAAGIAEALNTTIAGLVVAVVMVIFHTFFTRRLERIGARLEVVAGHLLHEFHKHGGPALHAPSATGPHDEPAPLSLARESGRSDFRP